METKRILVIGNESLIGAGIESLLAKEKTWDVIGITPADEQELLARIWFYRPQVIVMNQTLPYTSPSRLLNRLGQYPQVKLIVINESNNLIQMYEKQSVLAEAHIGLAALIRSNALELAYKTAVHLEPTAS